MGKDYFQKLWGNDYEKFIGERFIGKKVKDGIIYYKPEYAFLRNGWNAGKVREDFLASPPAALCKSHEYSEPYVKREYNQDGVKAGHFEKLCQLGEEKYDKISFEKVIGLKLQEGSDLGYLYHTYSGGIELIGINKLPKNLKDELKRVVIAAMAELSKWGINYHDPLPSNLRYNFDGRLICNPHNCIECYDRELTMEEQIENLSALLYTNSWIEKWGEFLSDCFKDTLPEAEIKRAKERVERKIKDMDEFGDIMEIPFHWWPRWGR